MLRREFRVDKLSPTERAYWKEHLFDELLVRTRARAAGGERDPGGAARLRRARFATASAPRVDGAAGRDAVAVAEMILERIDEHAWDGTSAGRHGPFAMPALPIIAGSTQTPSWQRERSRRRAG